MLSFILPAYTDLIPTSTQNLRKENHTHTSINPTVSKDNRLLSITFVGGLCVDGLCREELVINRDGSYNFKNAEHSKKAGVLAQKDITVLNLLTQKTDFGKIKSKKFDSVCPSAYDGAEKTYTFYIKERVEAFSDCRVQINPNQPLFKSLELIINKITVSPNK